MDAIGLIALQRLRGIGAKKTLSVYPDVPTGFQEFERFVARRFPRQTQQDCARAWTEALQIQERCDDLGVRAIPISDSCNYPRRFDVLDGDKPCVIYLRGSLNAMHDQPRVVAIVGTRHPTEDGIQTARSYGGFAARQGIPVVSGLAFGCDYNGHMGCIKEKGTALAVLAHGLDTVYPPQHHDLAEEIVRQGGCLVSEYPPGTRPSRWSFVRRDRLQSALSDLVIVIQTGEGGGTLHTVRAAIKQKRQVVCVHPKEYDRGEPNVKGNFEIVNDGRANWIEEPPEMLSLLEHPAKGSHVPRVKGTPGGLFSKQEEVLA